MKYKTGIAQLVASWRLGKIARCENNCERQATYGDLDYVDFGKAISVLLSRSAVF